MFITRRRRWSLVRIFASFVPEFLWKYLLPGPIRVNFNQSTIAKAKCDALESSNTPQNFNTFKSYLKESGKALDVNLISTPKVEPVQTQMRMSNIQKDLELLKDQVAKILRQQKEKLQCSDYGNFSNLSGEDSTLCRSYTELSPSPIAVESSR